MSTFDDLALGREFVSAARTISSGDVAAFAALTGDTFALHLDDEVAARSAYGRRIVHGMLVASCSIGLAIQMDLVNEVLIAFAGIDRLRFTAPVFVDDTIIVRKRITDKRPIDASRGLVTFETRVLNQHGDVVVAYDDRYLLRR
jgi:3-hydroxybutyryl-CoA dehydratase